MEAEAEKYRALPQVLASLSVSCGALCVGGYMSFSAVAIPKMMAESAAANNLTAGIVLDVDLSVGSWIASLFFLGTVAGCLLGGPLNQVLGPRRVILGCAPCALATWVMVALADRMWIIYLSRILSGILFGIFQANIKVYTAEIAHPDMRGALGAMISCMFSLGSLYTFTVAHFTPSWRTVAWSQLVGPALLGLSVTLIPESPYWLVERGQVEEARASLRRLRGARYRGLEDELAAIVQKKAGKAGGRVLAALLSRQFVQPFLRIGVLMSLTQWAGINVISSYMVTLLKEAGSSLDPSVAPIMVSGVQLVLSVLSTLVLRVSPRKPLFLLCAGVICLAQAALATHSFLTRNLEETPFGWVPVLAITLINSARMVGFTAVVQLLIAESFPTQIRAYSAGICGAFTGINQFGATKLFPVYLSNLGLHGTFWIYSGVMLLEIIYAAVSIPENKGESLVKTEDKMVVKAANFGTDNSAFDSDTSLRSDT